MSTPEDLEAPDQPKRLDDPKVHDASVFPDPVYKETVLRPLFDWAKTHHVEGFRAIDRAHLVMLAQTRILPRNTAGRIARALAEIDASIDPANLSYTGEVEDFFFLIEAELKKRLPADDAGRLHTGRSRNDIDHTLFKLALKPRVDRLTARLRMLAGATLSQAERERATLIVAYTHGQPAQPTTFGHYLAAAIEVMLRDHERLMQARHLLDLSPMGAAAITTSGFPLDRARVAHLLGFAAPLQNSYGCIAAIDYVTATYSAVELIFLHLGRLIQDLQVWTSFEVGQLYVPNAFVQISSIMPQKRNPVPIEHLRHLSSQTVARARLVRDVVHNTPFTDMNDAEGETNEAGYQAFATGERVLDLLAALLPSMSVDGRRVAENIRRSCITITELADTLVRREGLSFRVAHEIAADVARAIVAKDGDLPRDGFEPFAEAFTRHAGRAPALTRVDFAQAVSPEHFVAVRERFGGPGPQALASAFATYRMTLDAADKAASAIAAREDAARRELESAFADLLGSSLMAAIELQKLVKRYGKTQVVHGLDLSIADGEFVVFVGPSGCGKSTTLRMIAGLEDIDGGTISIGSRTVNQLEPKERNIAMVFQNYAIYPHMSVAENIGFGLHTAKLDKAEKRRRVVETGRILGLEDLLERKPAALSGGQRQRVAIGRAMVRDPAAFLFDEPLSNLDAQLRAQMRLEIKRLHQRLGTTIVFVTHDQVEAMTLADRIVVMRDGRILQVGAPMELYDKPADVFTARFIGSPTMNILPAQAATKAGTTTLSIGEKPIVLPNTSSQIPAGVLIGVRPQQLRVLDEGESSDLVLSGTVAVTEPLGPETFVHVEYGGGLILASASAKSPPAVGQNIRLGAPVSALTVFDAASERAL